MSKILRTPDNRFDSLPGFSFKPHYVDTLKAYEGIRIHYLDEQSVEESSQVFLCLHGQPTWSYLYRRMLPLFIETGARVVSPDFIGFGRTDKPVDDDLYTFNFHRNMLRELILHLDLTNITLVCQDWGGLLGLTLPVEFPKRFARLLVMNTGIGTGDRPLGEGFLAWRKWVSENPDMAVGRLMARSCPHLTPEESAAYDAPFPDKQYKAGVRRFPQLVPDNPEAEGGEISRAARDFLTNEWAGPTFMAIGMKDPVLGPEIMNNLKKLINGCSKPYEVPDGGHFVQEWGEAVAREALAYFRNYPG